MSFWDWIIKKMGKWPRWVVLGSMSVSVIAFIVVFCMLIGALSFLVSGPGTADAKSVKTEIDGYP